MTGEIGVIDVFNQFFGLVIGLIVGYLMVTLSIYQFIRYLKLRKKKEVNEGDYFDVE